MVTRSPGPAFCRFFYCTNEPRWPLLSEAGRFVALLALLVVVASCQGRTTGAVAVDRVGENDGANDPVYTFVFSDDDLPPVDKLDAATVPSSLGVRRDEVRVRCAALGGRWEDTWGESAWCLGAKGTWTGAVDERSWFTGDVLTAQTSFGPAETFEDAHARAERVGAEPWGVEELGSGDGDCAGLDLAARLQNAREQVCRWSQRWRDGHRRVHLFLAPRTTSTWRVAIDESRDPEGPPSSGHSFPSGFGSFRFGDSPERVARACVASGGHLVGSFPGPSCEHANIKELALSGVTVWLYSCHATGLCIMNMTRETSGERETVDLFIAARRAAIKTLGPPSAAAHGQCAETTPDRLVDALRDGHCALRAVWTMETHKPTGSGAHVILYIAREPKPADGNPKDPGPHWTVRFEPMSSKWLAPMGI